MLLIFCCEELIHNFTAFNTKVKKVPDNSIRINIEKQNSRNLLVMYRHYIFAAMKTYKSSLI